ncbi:MULTISPECIES: copper resistance protein B [unclassified Psychrobacter]|uniref:copper resistance protein B n=1 Tax=unclassified Psychrobacter TaxID=196806 RepID=UPI0018F4114F|nr:MULTISPECIES: copper resistance protein B [unclassified Psychrobacter]
MKMYKVGLPFIGISSLLLLLSPVANAAEMSNMDHGNMDMSNMDMSNMDHSGMDMSDMDMSNMDHSGMDMSDMDMSNMDHSGMDMSNMDMSNMDHSGMDMSDMDMSSMDHSSMDMSGMDHSSMDMSGMDHSSMNMDMSGMQGGEPPPNARSPDYSNGVDYGQYGKPVMMGSLPLWGVSVETLGYQFENDQIDFEAEGWYGTDSNRVTLRSEGSAQTNDDKEIDSLSSLAYWKPLGIFWNGEAGIAYNTENDKSAIMAGIAGTAPYFVETDARAYLYTDGQVQLDLGAAYEWRLDQRWMVRPELELTAFSKDDTDNGITKGFNEFEAEVRLAYETFSRQLAPYVGFSYESALGDARDLRRQEDEDVDSNSLTAGVMFWF